MDAWGFRPGEIGGVKKRPSNQSVGTPQMVVVRGQEADGLYPPVANIAIERKWTPPGMFARDWMNEKDGGSPRTVKVLFNGEGAVISGMASE